MKKKQLRKMIGGGPVPKMPTLKFKNAATADAISTGGNMAGGVIDAIDSPDRYGVRSGAGAALSGAAKGAAAGAQFGPIGAGVGAAIGTVTGLIGNNKAKKLRTATQNDEADTRAAQDKLLSETAMSDPANTAGIRGAKMYKYGGTLKGKPSNSFKGGAVFPAVVPKVDLLPDVTISPRKMMANGGSLKKLASDSVEVKGSSHAKGGVKFPELGVELEGGETVSNGFVFSKKLGFADQHKPIAKAKGVVEKLPESPDKESLMNTLAAKEASLAYQQESLKKSKGIKPVGGKMEDGGKLWPKVPGTTKVKRDGKWVSVTDAEADRLSAESTARYKAKQASDAKYAQDRKNGVPTTAEVAKAANRAKGDSLRLADFKRDDAAFKAKLANTAEASAAKIADNKKALDNLRLRDSKLFTSREHNKVEPQSTPSKERKAPSTDNGKVIKWPAKNNTSYWSNKPKDFSAFDNVEFTTAPKPGDNAPDIKNYVDKDGNLIKRDQWIKDNDAYTARHRVKGITNPKGLTTPISASSSKQAPTGKTVGGSKGSKGGKAPQVPAVREVLAGLDAKGKMVGIKPTIEQTVTAKAPKLPESFTVKKGVDNSKQIIEDAKMAKADKLSSIVDNVAPFVSNVANAFRKLPMPPKPTLQGGVTPSLVNMDADRAEATRQRRGADKAATQNLNGGNAASASRAANLAQEINATNRISQTENNMNSELKNRFQMINMNIKAGNDAKTDQYKTQLVERQLKDQELKSENLADASTKAQLLSRDKKMMRLEEDKILLEVGKDSTGAAFRTMRGLLKRRLSPEAYAQLEKANKEKEASYIADSKSLRSTVAKTKE